jgi:hypothetical protein
MWANHPAVRGNTTCAVPEAFESTVPSRETWRERQDNPVNDGGSLLALRYFRSQAGPRAGWEGLGKRPLQDLCCD